jgi:hypothetical protein
MSHESDTLDLSCSRAMTYVHRRLDEDDLDTPSLRWLEDHLAGCPGCRLAQRELAEIQRSLAELSPIPFPEVALHRVWDRTSRSRGRGGWVDWRGAAAAALLAAVLGGMWYAGKPDATQPAAVAATPSEAELARAAIEARYVLRVASAALRRSERAAVEEVLGEHVAPALSKIPIEWPGPPSPQGEERTKGGDDA